MPKFIVTERIPTFQTFIYEVEAESQTDALEMVLSGKAIESEMVIDEPDFSLAEYEIEDEDGERYGMEREDDDNTQDNDEEEYDGGSWDMQGR